ncbi:MULTISPECIES: hypothetical protein [Pseudomonas syringae group]|uniref:hypothetical protein n=1 Tax=Pseudomonas syringae group TaxID=136849 RepID=UPI0011C36349|nr:MULTISPECIES: hypothetical protein [Pseudomonas syringae group]MBN3471244.1 hypothetical protein [Pseudomonas savastanoi pv. phaseolicola]MBN3478126.1 hypothetical protein [Pseudomonas savastanoi pv. phaseolicola]UZS66458.1 hypothetical protein OQB65_19120 [Pseudomonas syringae]
MIQTALQLFDKGFSPKMETPEHRNSASRGAIIGGQPPPLLQVSAPFMANSILISKRGGVDWPIGL